MNKINKQQLRKLIPMSDLDGQIIRAKRVGTQYLIVVRQNDQYKTVNLLKSGTKIRLGIQTQHELFDDAISMYKSREHEMIAQQIEIQEIEY